MAADQPEYHLQKVSGQGGHDLRVCPLAAVPGAAKLSRRQLLAAGVSVASVLALIDGVPEVALGQPVARTAKPRSKVVFAHTKAVQSLSFSPDGKWLLSGSADETAKLWRMPDGQLQSVLKEHQSAVNCVGFSGDSRLAVTAGRDKRIRLWSLPDARCAATLDGHSESVESLAVSSQSGLMASGSAKGDVRLWSLPQGTPVHRFAAAKTAINLAILPDGSMLLGDGRDHALHLWSLPGGELKQTVAEPNGWINAVAVCPNGTLVATGGTTHSVVLRPLDNLEKSTVLSGHSGSINSLTISADSSLLASVANDKTIRLWSLPSGEMLQQLLGPFPFRSTAISPGGELLAAGDINGVISLWDLPARSLHGFLLDPEASSVDGLIYYRIDPVSKQKITYTVPSSEPLPDDAVCTCNSVSGKLEKQTAPRPQTAENLAKSRPTSPDRDAIAAARQQLKKQRDARAQAQAEAQQAVAMRYNYYMQNYLAHRPSLLGMNCRTVGSLTSSASSSSLRCVCDQICSCNQVSY